MKFFLILLLALVLGNEALQAETSGNAWNPFLPAATRQNWKVYNGAEFPGARGKLTEESNGDLLLSGTFEGRSVYVAAALRIPIPDPETRIRVTAITDCRIALRCRDGNGHYWQTAAIPLKAGETSALSVAPGQKWPIFWGGAQKGKQPLFPYRSIQINAMRMPDAPDLKLRIDAVEVPRGPVFLDLSPLPVQSLSQRECRSPNLMICNPKQETLLLSGEVRVIAYDETGETLKIHSELPGGEVYKIALPIPEKVQGSWRIVWDLKDRDSGIRFKGEDRFSRMIPAGPGSSSSLRGFLFGIAAHPENYSIREREQMAEAAALCGAQLIRTDARWTYQIQPEAGKWNYQILDSIVDIFRRKGIGIQLILAGCPNWAVAKDWKPKNPATKHPTWGRRPDDSAWRTFVRETVRRYAGRISLYEVWNEPDLISFANFSEEEYLRLLELAYREIKTVSPELKVISGGLSGYLPSREELFRRIAESPASDFLAFHGHGWPEGYLQQIKELKRILKKYPKPWYSNETAISSVSCGEYQQAAVLFKKLFMAWENGSIGYTWYNLREKGTDPTDSEHHYGMLTYDFKAKPVYLAFNTLTTLFRGAQLEGEFPVSSDLTSYCFRAENGDWLYPFWQSGSVSEFLYAVGGIQQGKAERIDLVGNRHPVPVKDSVAIIRSSAEPQILRIPAQKVRPVPLGKVFSGPTTLPVVPGGESSWNFSFHNPFKTELHWKISAEFPKSVTAFWPSEIKLLPGEKKQIRIQANASGETSIRSGLRNRALLSLSKEILRFPLQTKITIPWGKFPEQAQFQLRNADQVVSLVEHEPQNAHLFWHGPNDLSAEIRLARNSEMLKLRINVTDDKHVVRDFLSESWKSDGVQLAIALNEQKLPWKIGFSHIRSGQSAVFIWSAPKGFQAAKTAEQIHLKSFRDERRKQTIYEAEIPYRAIGLNPKKTESFRFNILVNDKDGDIRKFYLALAPGLGDRLDAAQYPTLYFK